MKERRLENGAKSGVKSLISELYQELYGKNLSSSGHVSSDFDSQLDQNHLEINWLSTETEPRKEFQ